MIHSSLHPLARVAHWRALAVMFVAFARQVVRQERGSARGAVAKVEQLDLWVRAALILLMRQIEDLRNAPAEPESQDAALQQLAAIAAALLTLAVLLQFVKQQTSGSGGCAVWHASEGRCPRSASMQMLAGLDFAPRTLLQMPGGYLDTS